MIIWFVAVLVLVATTSNIVFAKSQFSDDFANAEPSPCPCPSPSIYSFDVDYIVDNGDEFVVSKNKQATQETVHAKVGKPYQYRIIGDVNSADNQELQGVKMFLTKDKIKATDHSIKFGKVYNLKNIRQPCNENHECSFSFSGDIPSNTKKGAYSLVYHTFYDELQKYYITKIKIS